MTNPTPPSSVAIVTLVLRCDFCGMEPVPERIASVQLGEAEACIRCERGHLRLVPPSSVVRDGAPTKRFLSCNHARLAASHWCILDHGHEGAHTALTGEDCDERIEWPNVPATPASTERTGETFGSDTSAASRVVTDDGLKEALGSLVYHAVLDAGLDSGVARRVADGLYLCVGNEGTARGTAVRGAVASVIAVFREMFATTPVLTDGAGEAAFEAAYTRMDSFATGGPDPDIETLREDTFSLLNRFDALREENAKQAVALDTMRADSGHQRVFADIAAERERQDAQWGGAEHDDDHGYRDWRTYRAKFEQRIHDAGYVSPFDVERWVKVARESLVKIAALAVAQIESFDRDTAALDTAARTTSSGETADGK